MIHERQLGAVFFDLADTLAYLWVPKPERFAFLCKMAGLKVASAQQAEAGGRAFLHAWSAEEPGPVPGSLGWRGSHCAYRAGLEAMGCEDPTAGAQVLADAAQRLAFSISPDPEAAHLLSRLKQHGLSVGVISNHRGTLRANLRTVGLLRYYDVVLDSHLLGIRQAGPEHLPDGVRDGGRAAWQRRLRRGRTADRRRRCQEGGSPTRSPGPGGALPAAERSRGHVGYAFRSRAGPLPILSTENPIDPNPLTGDGAALYHPDQQLHTLASRVAEGLAQ